MYFKLFSRVNIFKVCLSSKDAIDIFTQNPEFLANNYLKKKKISPSLHHLTRIIDLYLQIYQDRLQSDIMGYVYTFLDQKNIVRIKV